MKHCRKKGRSAEYSLMLNGRGRIYEKHNVELVLTDEEAEALASLSGMLQDRVSEYDEAENQEMEL